MAGKRTPLIILAIVVAAAALLLASRGWFAHRMYDAAGDRIAARFNEKQRERYGGELEYTLDKFWSCYESDLVSQNDLTDVMDRMKRLTEGDELEDRDIFDFIGYVSHIYTEAIRESHDRTLGR